MGKQRIDIHQHITDSIIAAIEAGAGEWRMPWMRKSSGLPANVATGRKYRGVNVLALWVEAQLNGFSSNVWGTYRQWAEQGAQVRRGAKSSFIVFYREYDVKSDDAGAEAETRLVARATPVFNADQIDGYGPAVDAAAIEPNAAVHAIVVATGAVIRHGGDRACYVPATDEIKMPSRASFTGSATSGSEQAYHATLLHELTHWTAPAHRCGRDLTGRFGSDAYAMEELVAELGSAFLCAELGISPEPRQDHAQYLAHWLAVLKADKRAIFTAASKASEAVTFLTAPIA
jgi:antirestriction protein ArdC